MLGPGKTDIADALSCLNTDHVDYGEEYDYVTTVVVDSVPVALSHLKKSKRLPMLTRT